MADRLGFCDVPSLSGNLFGPVGAIALADADLVNGAQTREPPLEMSDTPKRCLICSLLTLACVCFEWYCSWTSTQRAGESGATARRGQEGFLGKMALDRQCNGTFVVM